MESKRKTVMGRLNSGQITNLIKRRLPSLFLVLNGKMKALNCALKISLKFALFFAIKISEINKKFK